MQVREHTESTARQYGLAEEAARLGWLATDIEVVDADLGLSGGQSNAPGRVQISGGTIRSTGASRGRATCRRNTTNWGRNTAISTSFLSDGGPKPRTPSIRRTIMNANVRTTTKTHRCTSQP
jgi:hypothetical protein